jgi:hypothetical protein
MLRSSKQKHTRLRTEPSFLSNQPFAVFAKGGPLRNVYLIYSVLIDRINPDQPRLIVRIKRKTAPGVSAGNRGLRAGGAAISAAESVHLFLTCLRGGAAPFGFKGAGFDCVFANRMNPNFGGYRSN